MANKPAAKAAIVAVARTPIGRAFRGAFNDTEAPVLGGHVIASLVKQTGIEAGMIDDVLFGIAAQQGTQSYNVARLSAYVAQLPTHVAGMTVDRMCASGLMTIAMGARSIMLGEQSVIVAGGLESISLTQNKHKNTYRAQSQAAIAAMPTAYIQMIETAEIVAKKYGIDRAAQDAYSLQSQQRVAHAQQAGLFASEIVPITVQKQLFDKEGNPAGTEMLTVSQDEGNRPDTTLDKLASLKPVWSGGKWIEQGAYITAGNASQLSDGAAAVLMMSDEKARAMGQNVLGWYRGSVVVGCAPEEMGIGPALAIPKLLAQQQLSMADIGVWEINEAFACQVLYCQEKLGIPSDRLNINGGAIAIGHPFGMSGARLTMHAILEAKRRNERYAVVSMCIGGGMGAAALFEIP